MECWTEVVQFVLGEEKRYLADCGDVWAMVQDDWRSDTYQFIAFTKVPALNNCVEYVSTGSPKRWDDNGGDTGIGDAINAFEKYVAEQVGLRTYC